MDASLRQSSLQQQLIMQNIHLEHPEDSILTGDLNVLDWFVAAGTLSVKMDGVPAIVWGTDPATNTFFVGTKAVFNKVKLRIAHSHEEIDQHYEGNVAKILHECLDYLPRTEGIFQGDFIGYGGDCEYTPNTITYQFPDVISQRIIIAPHTVYEANDDLRDSWAIPLMLNLDSTENVLFVKPKAYILHNQRSFADVEEVCDFARQMATTVTFVDNKGAAHLKKCINTFIRTGAVLDDEALSIAGNCDINLIRLWKLVKSIKEDCLFLCRNDGPAAYIRQDRIDAEGYVMSNEYGTYKLINREFFSHANFTMEKAWSK
jgi:Family of unknown function (DUF6267)